MAKKRKVNWQELQQFWTKNFGLSADDVFKVLEKEYFDKNYLGSKDKIGRVWMFKEHREELQYFIHQVEDYAKKNKTTFRKTALKFYDEHQEFIDEYVTNQAEQMGENFLSFLGSMNARFTNSIEDLDGIKTLMMVYSYESNAFDLYEELDHALNSGDFKNE